MTNNKGTFSRAFNSGWSANVYPSWKANFDEELTKTRLLHDSVDDNRDDVGNGVGNDDVSGDKVIKYMIRMLMLLTIV